ncbi:MAG TPA: DUF898 family protein [Saprospiraceae bacterium]|nr:DUF898 family protein [Saprospiraceae bacterium]
MEEILNQNESVEFAPNQERKFIRFFGKGSSFFGILILNFILTVVSLGLYYPWAKAKLRQYLWNETELEGSRFCFHGTGKEMFKGFIISYFFILLFYIGYFASISQTMENPIVFFVVLIVFFVFLVFGFYPFAIFFGWKYRVSRTSWRGIFFHFTGDFKSFYKMYIKYLGITILSFGIGSSWLSTNTQKYLFSHTQLGSLKLDFHGDGGDLFITRLGGFFLSYITLGFYLPVFIKNLFHFRINHTTISDGKIQRALKTELTGKQSFNVLFVNFLLLIFSLGLAFPFTQIRSYRLLLNSIEIPSDIDYDHIDQQPGAYNKATGDEMADILDIDLDF